MPRKKQAAKGKSKLPGIHISSLLGSNSDKPKKVDPADDKPSDNTLIENVVNCPTKLLDYEENKIRFAFFYNKKLHLEIQIYFAVLVFIVSIIR